MGTLLADDVRSDLASVDEIVANGETLHPDVKIATFPCEIEQRGVSLGKVDAKDVPSRTRVYGEHTFTSNVPAFGKTVDGDFLRRSLEGKAKGPGSGETINSKFTTPRQRWRASAPPTIRNEPSTRCPSQERWSSRLAFIVGGERGYETARPSGPPMNWSFALRQFTEHRVVLAVGVDHSLRVGRFECLFQQADFPSDASDELVEHLHVIYGFLDDLLVGRSAAETPLSVGVVVAKREKFFTPSFATVRRHRNDAGLRCLGRLRCVHHTQSRRTDAPAS